ncbi:hypothetical protein D3C87_1944620 [compost metagenome]
MRVARLPGGARRHHIGIGAEAVDHPEFVAMQAIALPFGLCLKGNAARVVARAFVHGQGQALFAADHRLQPVRLLRRIARQMQQRTAEHYTG